MKQVLQDRSGATSVRDVPSPPCPPGSVLVRNGFSVISAGTERARVELAKKSLVGKARERPDLVRQVVDKARKEGIRSTQQAVRRQLSQETAVGYSSAGTVVEVGAAVAGIEVGDRVACAGGGHANHAEIVSVPRNLVARIPDGVSLETASFTTIAAIAMHGVRLADVRLGERVAVVGCGLVGQIACRLLSAAGAEVFALDLDRTRVDAARAGGADHALTAGAGAAEQVIAATGGLGVDEVLITAAAPVNDPLLLAAEVVRDRGTVVMVGDVPIEAPRAPFFEKEIAFRLSRSYGPGRYDLDYEERGLDYPIGYVRWTEQRNMESVLDLQARGKLDLGDLIDEVVPVDDAARAYERLVGPAEQRPLGGVVLAYPDAASKNGRAPAPEPAPARPTSGSPRIGLIGPGGFAARVLVPAFRSAGAQLEAVAGGSGPSAEAATRDLGFGRALAGEDDLIGDAAVDALVVATRHGSHAELSRRGLEAGKHVFCEKPLALSRDELEPVVAAAAESGKVLTVGFNRRFSPLLRELRQFVGGSPRAMTASYRVSAGPLPADHWTHDLEQGGGRMIGEGCHFIDSLVFLAGAPVVEVHATGHGSHGAPLQARDNLVVSLTFENGSVGSVIYVAQGSPKVSKERIEVFAGGGTGVLDDYRTLELYGQTGVERRKGTQDKGHEQEVADFVAGVRAGRNPIPLEELRNVHLATFAAIESMQTGRPVRIDA